MKKIISVFVSALKYRWKITAGIVIEFDGDNSELHFMIAQKAASLVKEKYQVEKIYMTVGGVEFYPCVYNAPFYYGNGPVWLGSLTEGQTD